MEEHNNPFLSIGIIAKDEIRCIRRCLDSLKHLRQAVPCQLVIVDTGSTDGTREVAEEYADILLDFPWVNDFSAARNAGLERCTGQWFFFLDCDEWLCEDVDELVQFYHSSHAQNYHLAALRLQNFHVKENESLYTEFIPDRFFRMDLNPRFVGSVHESVRFNITPQGGLKKTTFQKVFLKHDGYMAQIKEEKGKNKRNLDLLLPLLEEQPQDLRLLCECIESCDDTARKEDFIRQSVELIQSGQEKKRSYIPSLLRHGITFYAMSKKVERMEQLWSMACERCPDSVYTKLDGASAMMMGYYTVKQYDKVVEIGRQWLLDRHTYDADPHAPLLSLEFGPLIFPTGKVSDIRLMLFESFCNIQNWQEAEALLYDIQVPRLAVHRIITLLDTLLQAAHQFREPFRAIHWAVMEQEERFQDEEQPTVTWNRYKVILLGKIELHFRNVGTLNTVIAQLENDLGKCAKALLQQEDMKLLEYAGQIENWGDVMSLLYETILKKCLPFPQRFYRSPIEVMGSIASKLPVLVGLSETFVRYSKEIPPVTRQEKSWYCGLAMSILAAGKWKNREQGNILCRNVARWEEELLGELYAPGVLEERNLNLLPISHRFGWYLVRAYQAQEQGNELSYVRELRAGLETAPYMKKLVDFLFQPVEQEDHLSPELMMLAEKVREILAQYDPEDPAVADLKNSEVYRKVAYYIEGTSVPVFGGFAQ